MGVDFSCQVLRFSLYKIQRIETAHQLWSKTCRGCRKPHRVWTIGFCKRYDNSFTKILFNILLSCNRNLDLAELSCNSVIMDIAQISKSALLFWEGDTCYRQVSPSVLQAVIASRKCLHLYILFFLSKFLQLSHQFLNVPHQNNLWVLIWRLSLKETLWIPCFAMK